MAPRYLLDTDICIYIRQKKSPRLLAYFQTLEPGEVAVSVVTYGELAYGVDKDSRPEHAVGLARLMELLPVLSLPEEAGKAYGKIRASLEAKGQTIGPNDLWIAAHAMVSGLVLVTNNEREFKRVKGLKIENWAK